MPDALLLSEALLADVLETAELAARVGGAVLQSWRGRFTPREKGQANLVTEADEASQAVIIQTVRQRFPEHDVLAEEAGAVPSPDADFCWIIDPLDGTTNYVHGFPFYCVSIAVAYRGELIAGVVFDPNRGELFRAVRGQGATLNGVRLQTSAVSRVADALVVASLPPVNNPQDLPVQQLVRVLSRAQSVQRTGSAAMNLAYVAAGRIDAFWSSNLYDWDMAAGVVLVCEAGGIATCLDGTSFHLGQRTVVACGTSGLNRAFRDCLQES